MFDMKSCICYAYNVKLESYIRNTIWADPIYFSLTYTGTFANSDDQDEMLQNAAFHLGLHCLLRQNRTSEKEIQ